MLGNLSKRPLGILLHASAVDILPTDVISVHGLEPMGLHCPHSDLPIFITPVLGELPAVGLEPRVNSSMLCQLSYTGIYKAQYCELALSQGGTFLQQVCIYLALIILSITTTSVYKTKEKTSKGICIGILHIPLFYINIII